jgi:hypothetical protein
MRIEDPEFTEHQVFTQLDDLSRFYSDLSFAVAGFVTMGTAPSLLNIDTYAFSSMSGSLESIKATLRRGRINDAYALVRKFFDSAMINVYCAAYLQAEFSIDNLLVEQIDSWISGKAGLPEYRQMAQYVRDAEALAPATSLLWADDRLKMVRKRCNDHTHYNFYAYVMLNDNEVHIPARASWLSRLDADLRAVVAMHLTCILLINPQYMMASDYIDALECDLQPEEGSQYLVSPCVQQTLDLMLRQERPELYECLRSHTSMELA